MTRLYRFFILEQPGRIRIADANGKLREAPFLDWIGSASGCGLLASVCTGSLLLGAAGLLKGKVATTNRSAFDILERYADVDPDIARWRGAHQRPRRVQFAPEGTVPTLRQRAQLKLWY